MKTATRRKSKTLAISPGLYIMRNGHTARVIGPLDLPYIDRSGEEKVLPIWNGLCLTCEERLTWHKNGNYSPLQQHNYDLVEAI